MIVCTYEIKFKDDHMLTETSWSEAQVEIALRNNLNAKQIK